MNEKIFQKLMKLRGTTSNISEQSIKDMAKNLESVITTDEQLDAWDATPLLKSLDGNINHYTSQQVKAKELEIAKKSSTAKTPEELAAEKKKADEDAANTPAWAQALIKQNEELQKRLEGIEAGKVTNTRSEQINKALENMPEYFKKPIVNGFSKMKFESDEEFNEYLTSVTEQRTEFEQAVKESGLPSFTTPKNVHVETTTETTPEISEARKLLNDQKKQQQANQQN